MKQEENVSEYLLNLVKNYSDSFIPSFSQLNPAIPNIKPEAEPPSSSSTKLVDEPNKERIRRASLKNYYTTLQSMLPSLGPNDKVPRSTVVSEAIGYIEELKEIVQVLEACKQEKEMASMASTYTSKSSNVDVTVSGEMAFFVIHLMSGRGLVPKVLMVFDEEHMAEVLTANVSVHGGVITLTVTAIIPGKGGKERHIILERIKEQIHYLLSSSSS